MLEVEVVDTGLPVSHLADTAELIGLELQAGSRPTKGETTGASARQVAQNHDGMAPVILSGSAHVPAE